MEDKGSTAITGGDVVIKVLEKYGIEALFTSPIAALAPLWEAFAKRDLEFGGAGKVPVYYNCRHETIAVSLAIGYYKSTGKMAAVCLPTGMGVLNGSMALRMARQERIPMLVISPDTLTFGEDQTKDPGPEWATFLIDDHGPAAHSALTTKWKTACRTEIDLIPNLHRAIYFARQVSRGPVMVEIPFDLLMAPFSQVPDRFPLAIASDGTEASEAHIAAIAALLSRASAPIIVTEHFGANPEAAATLAALAEALGAPVFEWWMPCYANIARSHALHATAPVESCLADADVVLVLCSHGPWHGPATPLREGARVVVVDEEPLRPRSAYWGYATTDCVSGDSQRNVERILAQLVRLRQSQEGASAVAAARVQAWTLRNLRDKRDFENKCAAEAACEADGGNGRPAVHASVFFTQLRQALPAGSIVVDEMVAQVPFFTHFLFSDPAKAFVHLRGWQGGLGTGLGVALGAKLAHPDKTVVCVVGDGAFNYNPVPAAFGFAQQYRCPILVCVMDNAGYVSQTWNFHRYFAGGAALSSGNTLGAVIEPSPRYALLAPVWGGRGIEVRAEAQAGDGGAGSGGGLVQALESALCEAVPAAASQVVVLDVSVTP